MRRKPGFVMREVAGDYVVVPTGPAVVDFSGMLTLNETGAFLWKHLESDVSQQELLSALLDEYDIDEATAQADTTEFLATLQAANLLE